jgi:hypothetical protein
VFVVSKVVNLFGEVVEIEDAGPRTKVGGECDTRCLQAQEDRCVCRCGGRNHGVLKHAEENESLDGERYIWLGHIPEIAKLFEGYVCPTCGTILETADILGYPRDGGLYVENYKMRLWVFARCRKCGYDTAWWKLGRSRLTTPEGWAR